MLVSSFLRRATHLYGGREGVVDGPKRFTYAQFAERCRGLAEKLHALGVRPGDRVGIVSPNSHVFLESFYATALLGAVLVPLNYRLTPDEIGYCLEHAGARVCLADAEYTALVHTEVRVAFGGRAPAGWLALEELPGSAFEEPARDENDLVSLNYTSGTTARPKGVMLTHRNFTVNAYNFLTHLHVQPEDVYLHTLPMFHCNGWGGVYALTGMGVRQVIVRAPTPELVFPAVLEEGVTLACMAPIVLGRLVDSGLTGGSLRVVCAGAPPPASLIERMETELGWKFLQIYGLTETSPIITISDRPGSSYGVRARAGCDALGAELAVLDGDGKPVPRDDATVGEVAVRGNMVFAGYWNQPEETARVMQHGYFMTGDLGTWDGEGSIQLVDRAKDVIISGGENISSIEVEEVLYRHPAVQEAAVIGVPSEEWGETPLAVVVRRSAVEAPELRDFLRSQLAHFKVPTRYEFVEALPRTATGKLKKFELREPYWRGLSRRIH